MALSCRFDMLTAPTRFSAASTKLRTFLPSALLNASGDWRETCQLLANPFRVGGQVA